MIGPDKLGVLGDCFERSFQQNDLTVTKKALCLIYSFDSTLRQSYKIKLTLFREKRLSKKPAPFLFLKKLML